MEGPRLEIYLRISLFRYIDRLKSCKLFLNKKGSIKKSEVN